MFLVGIQTAALLVTLWSINCGDVSTNDDRSLGNEKRRSIWKRRSNRTTKEKKKAAISVRELHKLQEIARPSDAKLFYTDVEKRKRKSNSGNTRGICCNEDETNS